MTCGMNLHITARNQRGISENGEYMKIRRSFVTNSSSASYILGKKDDVPGYDVESAYQLMRRIFLDYIADEVRYFKKNKEYFREHGVSLEWTKYSFRYTGEYEDILDALVGAPLEDGQYHYNEQHYDISKWIVQRRYADYLKLRGKDGVPFFGIIDLAEPITDISETVEAGQAVQWYNLDIPPQYFGAIHPDIGCESCQDWAYGCEGSCWFEANKEDGESAESTYPDEHKQYLRCQKMKKQFREGKLENLLLARMGKVFIYSEDSFLPMYVHERLEKIARYGCNHMG